MSCAGLVCGHLSRTDASKILVQVPFEMNMCFLDPSFKVKATGYDFQAYVYSVPSVVLSLCGKEMWCCAGGCVTTLIRC